MGKTRTKVFILVEGAKTDRKLMEKLFTMYGLDTDYEIVSYNTNIYTLYKEMFEDNNPEDMDLLQVLKSREKDPEKRQLFDEAYSDILLIFDLDPQDSGYTPEKIKRMSEFFTESTDMGKLYLNYPMVESFYHMQEIPDPLYENCFASLSELRAGTYKRRVTSENRNHDYRKFALLDIESHSVGGVYRDLTHMVALVNVFQCNKCHIFSSTFLHYPIYFAAAAALFLKEQAEKAAAKAPVYPCLLFISYQPQINRRFWTFRPYKV